MQSLTPNFALAREHLAAVAQAAAEPENTETAKEGCTTMIAEEPKTSSSVKLGQCKKYKDSGVTFDVYAEAMEVAAELVVVKGKRLCKHVHLCWMLWIA